MKKIRQLPYMRLTELAFSRQRIRRHAARAENREHIGLPKALLFHQVENHLIGGNIREHGVPIVVILNQPGQQRGQ